MDSGEDGSSEMKKKLILILLHFLIATNLTFTVWKWENR
jgi:hypothetical protein